jgi:membrane protein required for colicin V production
MAILDIILILIIVFFGYKGFKNGLIKELGSLIALIAGVFLAIRLSEFVSSLLSDKANFSSEYLPVISFSIIFIAIVILVLFFSKLLNQFMKLIKLQWLNKTAGVLFATIKMMIILGGLLYMFNLYNLRANILDQSIIDKSFLFGILTKIFEAIFPYTDHLNI